MPRRFGRSVFQRVIELDMRFFVSTLMTFLLLLGQLGCQEDTDSPFFSSRQAAKGEDGASCFFDNECKSGTCDTQFHLGYCTRLDCEEECIGPDAFCLDYFSGDRQCVDACKTSAECRGHYDCIAIDEKRSACLPKKHEGPTSGQLGASCQKTKCYPSLQCLDANRDGYCAGSCEDCESGVCQVLKGRSLCLGACEKNENCQLGDVCKKGACIPQASAPLDLQKSDALLGVRCDPKKIDDMVYEFSFTLAENTTSFSISTFVQRGIVEMLEVEKDGEPFGLARTYKHHNQRRLDFGLYPEQLGDYGRYVSDWTILVPYAPQFQGLVDTQADYVLRVKSPVEVPCFYVMESKGGKKVDINVYFATRLFNEKNASKNKDLQEILSALDALLTPAGIEIQTPRFHDLSEEEKERFSAILPSQIRALSSRGRPFSPTKDGHLSIDIFMVDDIFGGALGISPSLPGAPGLHGNANNGLVFSLVDLGFDNAGIGFIMAHEIGHYLGLRHTSETLSGENRERTKNIVGIQDPLSDTPFCETIDTDCPDSTNLMFPILPDKNKRVGTLTPMQSEVLRASPFVK